MSGAKPDVLLVGHRKPTIVDGLAGQVNLHVLNDAPDRDALLRSLADKAQAVAVTYMANKIDAAFMQALPKLEIVSSFGVGYDHIDARWAGEHGIVVTNTPEVLNEEVADTAVGLLISTIREFPQAERYLRAGKWPEKAFRLSKATLRDRTIGMVGMGRIGRAIAHRLEAFGAPVVYHSRRPADGVSYRYYPDLIEMARDVDVLMLIVPGGAGTHNMVGKAVLEALGPDGIVINVARGSVIDEPALIDALRRGTILSAGLDVFPNEPHVNPDLLMLDNVVLLPHIASGSEYTRRAMDQLVVDNILAWAAGKAPLTPVAETPWPPQRRS
ncbi:MAG TPA: 2-hydroxyacid dehydrogenase [Pseudolabrys sp.]|nr:2-hydroxyacid dehydrogenase [Pseudolabrys sp.]